MENENYVIVRSDRAGVFFGKLRERNGTEVELTDVRKLYYWRGEITPSPLIHYRPRPGDKRKGV